MSEDQKKLVLNVTDGFIVTPEGPVTDEEHMQTECDKIHATGASKGKNVMKKSKRMNAVSIL